MPLSFSTIFYTIIYVIFTLPDVEGRIICLE
jgi:hypothetical protein